MQASTNLGNPEILDVYINRKANFFNKAMKIIPELFGYILNSTLAVDQNNQQTPSCQRPCQMASESWLILLDGILSVTSIECSSLYSYLLVLSSSSCLKLTETSTKW